MPEKNKMPAAAVLAMMLLCACPAVPAETLPADELTEDQSWWAEDRST